MRYATFRHKTFDPSRHICIHAKVNFHLIYFVLLRRSRRQEAVSNGLTNTRRLLQLIPLGGDFVTEVDGETARLCIAHVFPEDEGQYTCVASNALGSARTTACLLVDGK